MRVHSHFPSEARTLRNTNTDTQPRLIARCPPLLPHPSTHQTQPSTSKSTSSTCEQWGECDKPCDTGARKRKCRGFVQEVITAALPRGANMAAPPGYKAKPGSSKCMCRGSGVGLDSCGTLCCAASPYTDPNPAGKYYHGTNKANNLCYEIRSSSLDLKSWDESESCNAEPCCAGTSWGAWTKCSAECDGGIRKRCVVCENAGWSMLCGVVRRRLASSVFSGEKDECGRQEAWPGGAAGGQTHACGSLRRQARAEGRRVYVWIFPIRLPPSAHARNSQCASQCSFPQLAPHP